MPPGIVTEVGTVIDELFDVKLTTVPPVGAGPSSVTVPLEESPPTTDVGDSVKLDKFAGITVNVVVWEIPAKDAVIVAGADAPTAKVPIEKVAVLDPAATVIEDGTIASSEFDVSATVVPPDTANPLSVTVPVAD